MSDYKRVPTSAEVWSVIKARHPDLRVFSSFSNPDGTFNGGDGTRGEIFTSYGFADSDYPIMEARTTWDITIESSYERINTVHKYWLVLLKKVDE